MPKGQVFIIKDPKWYCPECGHNKIIGKSEQAGEDYCEMWYQCAACGYEPAGDMGDRVETIWGWEDEYAGYALAVWIEKLDETETRKAVEP